MTKHKEEDHHCMPVCMDGFNWSENIMTVTFYEHKLIHATLNIPYSRLRKFRIRTNHLVHRNSQAYVNLLKDLHYVFFKNIKILPIKLQNKMRDCIKATTKRIIKEEQLILKLPAENAGLFKWLSSYHYALILR